jgi:hypothetical protein
MISKSDLIMAAMAAPSGPISGPAEYTPFGGAVTKIFCEQSKNTLLLETRQRGDESLRCVARSEGEGAVTWKK